MSRTVAIPASARAAGRASRYSGQSEGAAKRTVGMGGAFGDVSTVDSFSG